MQIVYDGTKSPCIVVQNSIENWRFIYHEGVDLLPARIDHLCAHRLASEADRHKSEEQADPKPCVQNEIPQQQRDVDYPLELALTRL